MNHLGKIEIGIVGSGWRAECFLRVARLLPHLFTVCGIVSRRTDRQKELTAQWDIPVFPTAAALLSKTTPEFVVSAVAKEAAAGVIKELAALDAPVLAETPPADNLEEMRALYRFLKPGTQLQIAEQYHFQPMHQARLNLLKTGRLGPVNYTHVSINHSYHGISLIRKSLGIGFENAVINGFSFQSPAIEGPGRNGLPNAERIIQNTHSLAILQFGTKTALFDFESNQHRSWARISQRLLIRGARGEINHDTVRYLHDYRTPITFDFQRQNAGECENLEGYYLSGILGGGEWLYRNPFIPARLSDDEIAMATCLVNMKRYLCEGISFYSLAEALQDQYLALMIEASRRQKGPVQTSTQIWAE